MLPTAEAGASAKSLDRSGIGDLPGMARDPEVMRWTSEEWPALTDKPASGAALDEVRLRQLGIELLARDVQVLNLAPGDLLCLRLGPNITATGSQMVDELLHRIGSVIPEGTRILACSPDAEIERLDGAHASQALALAEEASRMLAIDSEALTPGERTQIIDRAHGALTHLIERLGTGNVDLRVGGSRVPSRVVCAAARMLSEALGQRAPVGTVYLHYIEQAPPEYPEDRDGPWQPVWRAGVAGAVSATGLTPSGAVDALLTGLSVAQETLRRSRLTAASIYAAELLDPAWTKP